MCSPTELRAFSDGPYISRPGADQTKRAGVSGHEFDRPRSFRQIDSASTPPPLRADRAARRLRLDQAIGSIMGPVARRQPVNFERAQLLWAPTVGAVLARHTEPLSFENGVLYVGARGRDWRDALFHQRIAIARRLRRSLPGLKRIFISNLPLINIPTPVPQPVIPAGHPDADDISHAGLRDAFASLLHARDARSESTPESEL